MKKYFLFAAVAGMLASCSSESLTAGSDPNIEPTQEDRVPILLSVSSPSVKVSRGTTRAIGTGTVGGVGAGENKWFGQIINTFMFEKGGLTLASNETGSLYDDTQMITPGSVTNLIDDPVVESTPKPMGEAMRVDKKILYYPASEDFDFFGYHGAGAVTGAVDKTTAATTLWTVPFKIDGSHDLMSTKAATLDYDDLSTDQKAKFGNDEDTYDAFIDEGHFFSAKAARKLIQPVLSFNHLLSRLSFEVVPGNDNAGGWDTGTSTQDPTKAVYVKSIEVYSKTTGKMAVAWTSDPGANMITWDAATTTPAVVAEGAPDWLSLKERPITYCLNTNPATTIDKAAYDALSAADKLNYSLNTNIQLVALTPTYPVMTHAYDASNPEPTPVGEALIVAPKTFAEGAYQMRITVSQNVKTDWTGGTEEQTYTSTLDIPAPPTTGFEANTSYKVRLTVYGFERIEVMTKIIPWTEASEIIKVGGDED